MSAPTTRDLDVGRSSLARPSGQRMNESETVRYARDNSRLGLVPRAQPSRPSQIITQADATDPVGATWSMMRSSFVGREAVGEAPSMQVATPQQVQAQAAPVAPQAGQDQSQPGQDQSQPGQGSGRYGMGPNRYVRPGANERAGQDRAAAIRTIEGFARSVAFAVQNVATLTESILTNRQRYAEASRPKPDAQGESPSGQKPKTQPQSTNPSRRPASRQAAGQRRESSAAPTDARSTYLRVDGTPSTKPLTAAQREAYRSRRKPGGGQ